VTEKFEPFVDKIFPCKQIKNTRRKAVKIAYASLMLAILLTTACITVVAPAPNSTPAGGSEATPTIPQSNTLAPAILSFDVSPAAISAGGAATLRWAVSNASSVNINPEIGAVALQGSRTVNPPGSVTYILTATNQYGSSSATAILSISGGSAQPAASSFNLPTIATFAARPANIVMGGMSTLVWDVRNSFDVSIEPRFGIIRPSGSQPVNPPFTTTYKLTANNNEGSILATTTLTVSGVPPTVDTPFVRYFTANPYVIRRGEPAVLSWQTELGSSVTIDNNIGTVGAEGTTEVRPNVTTTYMLTVTGPDGGQFQTTTVNVK
jgi:hypothetical protein